MISRPGKQLEIAHNTRGTPMVALSVCEYALPTLPQASAPVVILNVRVAMVIVTFSVSDALIGVPLSVALTVNVLVPVLVGVPEITPSEVSVSPLGRVPDVRVHV